MPPTEVATSENAGKICAICSSNICQGEAIVTCPTCKLPYHCDCWKEIGGCGTYGCTSAPEVPKTDTAPVDAFQPGWTSEKSCPACGKKILANALLCKWCKASFPHEKPMTKQEYLNREYDNEEFAKIRNIVIGNFIFSAVGCFFPISLTVNLLHWKLSEGFLFHYKRLTPTLRFIFHSSLAVSLLWTVLFTVFYFFS
ncbi:MAG: hypothetical protein HQM08_01680 [Candidatus Riflebacteria bacterium]|nr:hypothetical protein [Candidatus Riflebacteria bacterium]